MARGWESKSVEALQADAADKGNSGRTRLSPAEAARAREKEGLRLSRQSVVRQLESATATLHRKLLQDALADLDRKLRELGS
jgi:hypothetical protein